MAQLIGVMCPGANLSFPEAELFFLLKAVKGFPGSPLVKNLPAVQETQESRVQSWVGKIPWRRKWQPTAVFLPGEAHGQRSLVDHCPWGCKQLDTTK